MQNSPQDLRRKILGRKGEGLVARYLKRHGYKILRRNYRTPFGEADIVAYKEGCTCFVEVKTRSGDAYGVPSEGVTRDKRRRYRSIAGYYIAECGEEVSVRFDVAAVSDGKLEYIENAFI